MDMAFLISKMLPPGTDLAKTMAQLQAIGIAIQATEQRTAQLVEGQKLLAGALTDALARLERIEAHLSRPT